MTDVVHCILKVVMIDLEEFAQEFDLRSTLQRHFQRSDSDARALNF